MTSEIDRLGGKLDALASLDTTHRIFGASEHGYAREPVAERELAALEAAVGFALPEDYRHWMLRIGAGAGPYYGLWAPARALQQIGWTSAGTGGHVRDATEIAPVQLEAMAQRMRDGIAPVDASITTDTTRGAVPIAHMGCNGYAYLMLDGVYTGCVFGENEDCVGEPWTAAAAFWPAGAPSTVEPPTFLVWLEDWLDRSLARIGAEA